MVKVKIWENGTEKEVEKSTLNLPTTTGPVFDFSPKKIYKADIWRKCTDAEFTAIKAVIKSLDERTQAIFNDANYIDIRDALYPLVLQGATAAVGEERALELLIPSE